jgi:DNA-binding MarR family transcriptional regulator
MITEFNLENTLGYLINRCAIMLKNQLTHRFNQAGYEITPEEWAILNRLWEQDGMSQNELAERTIKDKTTITRFLHQMENKGLTVRRSSQTDGRAKNVYLTSKGQQLKPILIQITKGLLNEVATDLSDNDLQITFSTLRKMENSLVNIEKANS